MANNQNQSGSRTGTDTTTNTNDANKQRIAELQKGEAEGRLTDEEAAELSRLQQETSAE